MTWAVPGPDSGDGSGSFHDHDRIIGGVEGQTQDGVAVAIEGLNREPLLLPDCERQGIGADIELGDTLRPARLGPGEEDHGWDQEMSKCFHDSELVAPAMTEPQGPDHGER